MPCHILTYKTGETDPDIVMVGDRGQNLRDKTRLTSDIASYLSKTDRQEKEILICHDRICCDRICCNKIITIGAHLFVVQLHYTLFEFLKPITKDCSCTKCFSSQTTLLVLRKHLNQIFCQKLRCTQKIFAMICIINNS